VEDGRIRYVPGKQVGEVSREIPVVTLEGRQRPADLLKMPGAEPNRILFQ